MKNLRLAKKCIVAGQNPMHLTLSNCHTAFFFEAQLSPDIKSEFLSILALRQHFDLNDAHISDPSVIAQQTPLHVVAEDCQYKKLHLLLQTGIDVNAPCWITNTVHPYYLHEIYQKSIFTSVSDPIVALMLLFSDGNPREKVFPRTAKSQVRVSVTNANYSPPLRPFFIKTKGGGNK